MANYFKDFMLTQYTTKQLIEELDKRIGIETIEVDKDEQFKVKTKGIVRLSQGPVTIIIHKEQCWYNR